MNDFDDLINLGKAIINEELTHDRFIKYKKKVKNLGSLLKNKALAGNEPVLPVIEDLIKLDEESYKVIIIFRFSFLKNINTDIPLIPGQTNLNIYN